MVPWTQPRVEMAVASLVSPSGTVAAGRHGLGVLSLQAVGAQALDTLPANWEIGEETAAKHGKTMDRRQLAADLADAYRRKPRAGGAGLPLRLRAMGRLFQAMSRPCR